MCRVRSPPAPAPALPCRHRHRHRHQFQPSRVEGLDEGRNQHQHQHQYQCQRRGRCPIGRSSRRVTLQFHSNPIPIGGFKPSAPGLFPPAAPAPFRISVAGRSASTYSGWQSASLRRSLAFSANTLGCVHVQRRGFTRGLHAACSAQGLLEGCVQRAARWVHWRVACSVQRWGFIGGLHAARRVRRRIGAGVGQGQSLDGRYHRTTK